MFSKRLLPEIKPTLIRPPIEPTAQAIGDVELWTIAKTDFMKLMEQYPTLAVTVTSLIADDGHGGLTESETTSFKTQ